MAVSGVAMAGFPRERIRSPALVLAVLLGLSGLLGLPSLGFLAPTALGSATADAGAWICGMQAEASATEPRTAMRASPDRTRKLGGGRLRQTMNRKPVHGYSIADVKEGVITETAASVLRRLRAMIDQDHVNMVTQRQMFFRKAPMKNKWTKDFRWKLNRRLKLRRAKSDFEAAFQGWMRTQGRDMGFTQPVKFEGPKLAEWLTPELDKATDPERVFKILPSRAEFRADRKKYEKGWSHYIPSDLEPGKWNPDEEADIFKIWKRPLHKHPYDIGKKGGRRIVRGIVF
eukprot:TRINITY_DN72445_c0_g1_i1.p1 TRINITY_DN72445_c0_g1~~TRINITY_DN72445_c0_g1_i1.p1  ORF type:complete len:287 (-),score=49.53 TRINITY_DN72445_c0_g1_i1:19-879(-)